VLTDHFLADSQFSIPDFDLDAVNPSFSLYDPQEISEYRRYQLTENGISPRLYPGQSKHLVGVDSDEHDEEGHITEDLGKTVKTMVQKRLAKIGGLREEISPPEEIYGDDGETVLVGWGSSRGALLEAVRLLKREGKKAGMLHFTELWPLPEFTFPEGKTYITVESNATGQLARLLRSEYGVPLKGAISRYDGLPLTGEYIRSRFDDYDG
jgi:2-oxoglutarate ferredoxin oxidoreductase subunit alpha